MVLGARIWLVDSPENGKDIAERFFQYRSLGKIAMIRTTAIDVIKKVIPFKAFASSGE